MILIENVNMLIEIVDISFRVVGTVIRFVKILMGCARIVVQMLVGFAKISIGVDRILTGFVWLLIGSG